MAFSRAEIRQWPLPIVGNTSPSSFFIVLYDSCASTSSADWILSTSMKQFFYSFHEACHWALALCDAHTPEPRIILILGRDFDQLLGRNKCCAIESRQRSGESSRRPIAYVDMELLHRSRANGIQHQSLAFNIKMLRLLSKVECVLVNYRMIGHFQDSRKRIRSGDEWFIASGQINPYHFAVLLDFTGGITWLPLEAVLYAVAERRKPYAAARTFRVVVRTAGGADRGVAIGASLFDIQPAGLTEGLGDRAEV